MGTHTFTVSPSVRSLLADLAIPTGVVLRAAGLPADLLARPTIALSVSQYYALWTALAEVTDDPLLPITVARSLSVEQFDPPLLAALCSPNLQVAAERIQAHKRLLGPVRLRLDRLEGAVRLVVEWPPGPPPPAVLVTTEALFWVALARIGTRAQIAPLAVTMPEPPGNAEAYGSYLGGVSIREDRETTVTFSRLDLVRPFLTANAGMWEFFEAELGARLERLDHQASTTERVRAALLELLPAGRGTMTQVGRHLGVTTRTLQRRLGEDRTSFQAVLGETREALARRYLAESTLSLTEIAFLVGYDDPNSFHRAFHQRTGQTPQRVRESLRVTSG